MHFPDHSELYVKAICTTKDFSSVYERNTIEQQWKLATRELNEFLAEDPETNAKLEEYFGVHAENFGAVKRRIRFLSEYIGRLIKQQELFNPESPSYKKLKDAPSKKAVLNDVLISVDYFKSNIVRFLFIDILIVLPVVLLLILIGSWAKWLLYGASVYYVYRFVWMFVLVFFFTRIGRLNRLKYGLFKGTHYIIVGVYGILLMLPCVVLALTIFAKPVGMSPGDAIRVYFDWVRAGALLDLSESFGWTRLGSEVSSGQLSVGIIQFLVRTVSGISMGAILFGVTLMFRQAQRTKRLKIAINKDGFLA
ncbi:MAG: hypothetical protein ACON4C_07270 [Henriciella sp.]